MTTTNESVLYRVHRLRFAFLLPISILFTVGTAALGYDGLVLGDKNVNGAWLFPLLMILFLWFDWVILAKLLWPPELEISRTGIRWENRSMAEPQASYTWQAIEGPEQCSGNGGVSLLQFVVKSSGKKLRVPPSHFGATFDEISAVIEAARSGRQLSPEQWRIEHPPTPFKDWIFGWGLPIAAGIVIAIMLGGRR